MENMARPVATAEAEPAQAPRPRSSLLVLWRRNHWQSSCAEELDDFRDP